MRNWWWLVGAIPAILILRIAGFVGNFWTGLGVVALLAFLALLEAFPVAVRRFIWVFFAGWVILFLGLPAVWNVALATRPLTREALEKRGVATDLQVSEFADPVALRAKLGIARYCRELEDVRGQQLTLILQQSLESQRRNPYGSSVENTRATLETLLKQIEKDREECKKLLSGVEPLQSGIAGQRSVLSVKWLWVLGTVGVLLLTILLFRARRFWALAFLIAATLVIGWYFSDGRITMAQATEQPRLSQAPRVEEFTINADEEKPTVLNGPGTVHRIQANKTWIAIAADPSGKIVEYPMPAGSFRWIGGEPEDLLRVRGVEDGTTLRFERVSK